MNSLPSLFLRTAIANLVAFVPCSCWSDEPVEPPDSGLTYRKISFPTDGDSVILPEITKKFTPEQVRHDIGEFQRLLREEWMLSNVTDADFDAAFEGLRNRAGKGMSYAQLLLEFQKLLALGKDGHAEMNFLLPVMNSVQTCVGFPEFLIDICGDDYIAYKVVHLPNGPVNPRYKYRFEPLREGYPFLVEIDGIEIGKWIDCVSEYVAKGPKLSVRWRTLEKIHYLPFWREKMGLPKSNTIRVKLASEDKKTTVQLDAPVGKYALPHYRIPKPDWKIMENDIGYLWVRNPASGGVQVIMDAMPAFHETKGLIVDLRGNHGGAELDTLRFLAAFLLPKESPRRVVGSVVQWSGETWDSNISPNDPGLSKEGRSVILQFNKQFPPKWKPPTNRRVDWCYTLVARPEAEPNIRPFNDPEFPIELFPMYHYRQPVVILYDQRCFSASELFLAGVRHLDNVTLIGTETTSAAGTSAGLFKLPKTGIEVGIGSGSTFIPRDGVPLDVTGVRPDIVLAPDADYYLGRRDRMIAKAVDLLAQDAQD